jgi:hypothetical protein
MVVNCRNCGHSNPNKRCSACLKVFYCSEECQKRDWTEGDHKNNCAKLRKACVIDGDELTEEVIALTNNELADRSVWFKCNVPFMLNAFLLVKRLGPSTQQNQVKEISSVMMMDPKTGLTPREWESQQHQKLIFVDVKRGISGYYFWNVYDYIKQCKELYLEGKSEFVQNKLLNYGAYNKITVLNQTFTLNNEGKFKIRENLDNLSNIAYEMPENVFVSND